MSGRVVVEIERLVVEGIAGSERGVVALALQRELERLVAERGIPAELVGAGELPVLEADLGITEFDRAAAIGTRAGQALYGALSL
jgi:hypothetical protein